MYIVQHYILLWATSISKKLRKKPSSLDCSVDAGPTEIPPRRRPTKKPNILFFLKNDLE